MQKIVDKWQKKQIHFGMMAVIPCSPSRAHSLLSTPPLHSLSLCIANLNSNNQTVFSGKMEEIEFVRHFLKTQKLRGVILPVDVPFHSPFLKEGESEFRDVLSQLDFKSSHFPIISNVTAQHVNKPFDSIRF